MSESEVPPIPSAEPTEKKAEAPQTSVAPDTKPLETACQDLIGLRKRPLLVLYYAPYGSMEEADVADCYTVLRNGGVSHEHKLKECDVLVHTTGGNPLAGYRLAQCIRDFAKSVAFLVPEYSYSAGTLMCFAGNDIRLGHGAGLSPIDITSVEVREDGRDEVQLASIDSYMQFSERAQEHIQRVLMRLKIDTASAAGTDLLCTLVEQVGALKVGEYYRARTITGHYAEELLGAYMLRGKANASGRRDRIIRELLFEKPAHQFHVDFHICSKTGLEVHEMTTREHDACAKLLNELNKLEERKAICPFVTNSSQLPFIAYYPFVQQPVSQKGGHP